MSREAEGRTPCHRRFYGARFLISALPTGLSLEMNAEARVKTCPGNPLATGSKAPFLGCSDPVFRGQASLPPCCYH